MKRLIFPLCLLAAAIIHAQPVKIPVTKKTDQTDNYFGTEIKDPYRWLEDDHSPETAEWVTMQNKATFAYLDQIPFRDKIKERLTQLWNYPRRSAPSREGNYYFHSSNDGIQNQSVIMIQKNLGSRSLVFMDPNLLSKDGTVSLSGRSISHDGRYMAYSLSRGGSDWNEILIRDIANSTDLHDTIRWVKFSGMSWYKNGFYYSGYSKPDDSDVLKKKNEFHKVFYHKLGEPQSNDRLVYEDKEHPLRNFYGGVTEDERFLIIQSSESTSGNDLLVKDLSVPGSDFIRLVSGYEKDYDVIDSDGNGLLIFTNYNAPRGKLVRVDMSKPQQEFWQDLVPEHNAAVLQSITIAGDKLVARYLKDAVNYLEVFDRKGQSVDRIIPPVMSTIDDINGNRKDSLLFYSVTSFTFPSVIYKYNLNTKQAVEFQRTKIDFNADDYETKQVWYKSKDGVRIPMFLVHKKGIKHDKNNPVFLYGYGGFNISMTPSFSVSRLLFLENGGIYAMPNLRGGGEYGEQWHKAGTKHNKQNVFNDFIAAAEYLISEDYTNPGRIAIHGRSNGGLLIGACMTQRPDLFKVALPAVGVLDMLRYHKFTIGWAWTTDFGSSDNPDEFPYLLKYSPLHNIREGVEYPATLVTTADHDDRVVPAHSYKFIATLQEKYKGTNPVLIRIDTMAGHGAGKPTAKQIDEWADIFSFVFFNLGINY